MAKHSEQNIQKSWSALWPRTASCWVDVDLIPLQVLREELQSRNIADGITSIQNLIGAMKFSNDLTEEDINDRAIGANEFSLKFSDVEIIQHAKQKESPVLPTDSEDDFVGMVAKAKISTADAKKSFSVCISALRRNNFHSALALEISVRSGPIVSCAIFLVYMHPLYS